MQTTTGQVFQISYYVCSIGNAKNEIFTSKYLALYGTCVDGNVTNGVYEPGYYKMTKEITLPEKGRNVQGCIAGCRNYQDQVDKKYGFKFAGLGKYEGGLHCLCGDEPKLEDEPHQFGDLFAPSPYCRARCPDAKWQRCGGRGRAAVSVWSVPTNGEKADLGGICVNSYSDENSDHEIPFNGPTAHVNGPGECREFCRGKGFG